MLATGQALKLRVAANEAVVRYGATIVGLNEINADTPLPAVAIAEGAPQRSHKDSPEFFDETWGIWAFAEPGDDFTVKDLAESLLFDLNQASLDNPGIGRTVLLNLKYLFDGPSRLDGTAKLQFKVQYFQVLSQKIQSP
jgi:hypothetical protein